MVPVPSWAPDWQVRRLSMLRNDKVRTTCDVLRLPDVRRIELG
jgi:hypothetical protein